MMKPALAMRLLLATLPLFVLAGPANKPAKGGPKKTLNELAPFIDPSSIETVKPLVRANAIRRIIRYGPLTLPALKPTPMNATGHSEMEGTSLMDASVSTMLDKSQLIRGGISLAIADFLSKTMDPEGFNTMHQTKNGICQDCTILSSKIDVVWPNGTRADLLSGVYLHHVIALNLRKGKMRDADLFTNAIPFCAVKGPAVGMLQSAVGSIMNLLRYTSAGVYGFGAVDEFRQYFTTPDGKFDSGLHRGADDWLLYQAEIVNYKPEPQEVYLQFDVEHVPGQVGQPASTQFTSATSCNESLSFMRKGKGQLDGTGHVITNDGTLITARGHMHDGGSGMEVLVNGKSTCVSDAEYATAYAVAGTKANWKTISKMGDCTKAVYVKKGDNVTIIAKYDTEAHPLRESNGEAQMQMGLVAFTFAPDKK